MSAVDQQRELSLIIGEAHPDSMPAGLHAFEIDMKCRRTAIDVLASVREVLTVIVRQDPEAWPELDKWYRLLPNWFVQACCPELSAEEAQAWLERWRKRSDNKQNTLEQDEPWSVGEFVHWFQPSERQWWWWKAEVVGTEKLRIFLAVEELTPAHEALDWLLRVAGAADVVDENLRRFVRGS